MTLTNGALITLIAHDCNHNYTGDALDARRSTFKETHHVGLQLDQATKKR
jgi:hypothetical protein